MLRRLWCMIVGHKLATRSLNKTVKAYYCTRCGFEPWKDL